MEAYADRFINETTKAGLDPNTSLHQKAKASAVISENLKQMISVMINVLTTPCKNALTVLKAGRPKLVQTGILLYH